MPNRRVEITTPTHPVALTLYAMIALSGIFYVFTNQPEMMVGAIGPSLTGIWATITGFSGVLAAWGAILAPRRRRDPVPPLRVEMVGCIGIALTWLIYEIIYAATLQSGSFRPHTLVFFVIVGAAWRAIQARVQVSKIKEVTLLLASEVIEGEITGEISGGEDKMGGSGNTART